MVALTIAVAVAFAGAVVEAPSSTDIAPVAGIAAPAAGIATSAADIVAAEGDAYIFDEDFQAPAVFHRVEGQCADPTLPFPYQLNLYGMNNDQQRVTGFYLYVIDTETRANVTSADHIDGTLFPAGLGSTPVLTTSDRGPVIYITPEVITAPPRVFAQLVVLLQHGQEVIVTTSLENPPAAGQPDFPARGLDMMEAMSFFWLNGPPSGFSPGDFNLGETDGFGPEHRNYSFYLPDTAPPFYTAPMHFHALMGGLDPEYAEGFLVQTLSQLQLRILGLHHNDPAPVRVGGVWTFGGDCIDSVEATVNITKIVEFSDETTDVATSFEFEVTPLRFYEPSEAVSSPLTTPTVDDVVVTVPAGTIGVPAIGVPAYAPAVIAGLDRPGTFVFGVTEVGVAAPGLPAGVTEDAFSDAEYEITIVVGVNAEGYLYVVSYVVTSVGPPDDTSQNPPYVMWPIFTNVLTYTPYVPTPPLGSVETTVAIEKMLNVSTTATVTTPDIDFVFEFVQQDVSDATTLTADVTVDGDLVTPPGTTFMGLGEMELSFEETGTFVFRATERPSVDDPLPAGMDVTTFSSAEYEITIVVVENDGALEIYSIRVEVITADPNGLAQGTYFYLPGADALVFTNALTYTPVPVTCPCDGGDPCTCDINGQCPCDNDPCNCVQQPPCCCDCGYENCTCEDYTPGCDCGPGTQPGQPCDVCGEEPCVCATPQQPCDECDEYPCVCEEYDPDRAPGDGDDDATGDDRRPAAGPKTGDYSNAATHLLHMLVAAIVIAVVLYRFTCPSEALVRRKS